MHGPATPFVKSDCKHLEAIGDGLELSKEGRGWRVKSLLIYIRVLLVLRIEVTALGSAKKKPEW